jgi:hypothetical protein
MVKWLGIVTFKDFDKFKKNFYDLLKNNLDYELVVVVDEVDSKEYKEFFRGLLLNNFRVVKNKGSDSSGLVACNYLFNKGASECLIVTEGGNRVFSKE